MCDLRIEAAKTKFRFTSKPLCISFSLNQSKTEDQDNFLYWIKSILYVNVLELPSIGKYEDQSFDIFHSCVNINFHLFLQLPVVLIVDYFHWEWLMVVAIATVFVGTKQWNIVHIHRRTYLFYDRLKIQEWMEQSEIKKKLKTKIIKKGIWKMAVSWKNFQAKTLTT